MHAEIVSIGSELTTGAKLDTNSQWLSLELSAVGIPVHFHTTIADDLAANIAALRIAAERSEIVLITGGLGPTLDDLTRDALAQLAGVPLVLHEPSLEIIRGMFERRGRTMPERNVVQAMFPLGSVPIPNPRGTAPGVYMEYPRGAGVCQIAAMPGVPSEMKGMFRDEVLPRLATGEVQRVIRHARINSFGLGESAAEEMLGDVTKRGRDPEVGITVHEATITLRIVSEAGTVEECQRKILETRETIYQRLGDYIFGEEDDELQHTVVRSLVKAGQTLAVADAGTGGLIAQWLFGAAQTEPQAERERALAAVTGALVAPSLQKLESWLKTTEGVASADAAATAAACRSRFGADFGLALSEWGPLPEVGEQGAVPLSTIALASAEGVVTRELNLAGDPAIIRSRLAKSALNLLRLKILGRLT